MATLLPWIVLKPIPATLAARLSWPGTGTMAFRWRGFGGSTQCKCWNLRTKTTSLLFSGRTEIGELSARCSGGFARPLETNEFAIDRHATLGGVKWPRRSSDRCQSESPPTRRCESRSRHFSSVLATFRGSLVSATNIREVSVSVTTEVALKGG